MTHFGIICPPYSGHLNPLAALGRELQSRNHQVTFLQIPDLEQKICAEGVGFYPIGQSSYRPGTMTETFTQLAKLSDRRALRYSVRFCQEMAEILCRDAPGAIAKTGIEVLLVDQLEPVGETIAEGLSLPFITISNGQAIHRRWDVPPFFTSWSYRSAGWAQLRNFVAYSLLDRGCEPILRVINDYRQRWYLPPYHQIYASHSRLAHLSQQPAAFDFPIPNLPKHFHYVGPLRNAPPRSVPFPYDRLTGQPLIYASLGSVQNTKYEIFSCIAAACEGLDAQLVITHGGGMASEAARSLPGSPLVVDYAPQVEVLARAQLTITHGGLNTILDSLSQGVPLVTIPITFEQPGNAARVRWTGTGEVVPLSRLSSTSLQAAIEQVLSKEPYRDNARHVQRSIAQSGGVTRAADIIERSLRLTPQTVEREPVLTSTPNPVSLTT